VAGHHPSIAALITQAWTRPQEKLSDPMTPDRVEAVTLDMDWQLIRGWWSGCWGCTRIWGTSGGVGEPVGRMTSGRGGKSSTAGGW